MLRLPECHAFSCRAFVSADIFVTTGCRTAFQGSNQASGCSGRTALSRAGRRHRWYVGAVTGSTCAGSATISPVCPHVSLGCRCEISRHRRVRGMHLPDHAVRCQKSSRRGDGSSVKIINCSDAIRRGGTAQVFEVRLGATPPKRGTVACAGNGVRRSESAGAVRIDRLWDPPLRVSHRWRWCCPHRPATGSTPVRG